MKKIFLSLLALVGVVGCLLCTSCSGGGGKDKDGYARALTGVTLELWDAVTPSLTMMINQPISANVCSVMYRPGESPKGYSGKFSIKSVEKASTGTHKGQWMVMGAVNITDSDILTDSEFMTILGAGEEKIQSLREFTIVLYFTEGGKAGDVEFWAKGTYGEDMKPIENHYPDDGTYDIIGNKEPDYKYWSGEYETK